MFVTCNK